MKCQDDACSDFCVAKHMGCCILYELYILQSMSHYPRQELQRREGRCSGYVVTVLILFSAYETILDITFSVK